MKRLLPVLMVFGVLLGSARESFVLFRYPEEGAGAYCDNCSGTYTNAKGDMYVGLQPVSKEERAPFRLPFGSRRGNGVLSS